MPAVPEFFDSPGFAFTTLMMLIIRPTAAKGIFIQLYAPRHGMKPISIPATASIPQIKLMNCIIIFF